MTDDVDTEEIGGLVPRDGGPSVKKRSFSFLETSLSPIAEKDYKSPLIGKFLKDHIDRIEDEVAELRPYREKYYQECAKLQVLQERRGLTRTAAGVSSVMLAVGGIGIGVAKDLWALGASGPIIAVCSLLLICCSFLIRVRSS